MRQINSQDQHFFVLPDLTAIPVPRPTGKTDFSNLVSDSITVVGPTVHSPQMWASAQAAFLNAETHLGMAEYAAFHQAASVVASHPDMAIHRDRSVQNAAELIQNHKRVLRQNAGGVQSPQMLRTLAQTISEYTHTRNTCHVPEPQAPVLIEYRQR